ncbi:DMT family transporter [Candidatus Babeliales bacterium]|nr:DMT family transporter [Candidatus Babeliales bacterium]MCF7899628.1 DMT family transporter [Candidatus Babeliales bacterium]
MFLIILLYAILASTFTLAKTVLFYAKPFFIIGFRMTLAGILLLLFQTIINKKRVLPNKKDWPLFFKVSLFHIYFFFMLEFWALQKMPSSKVTLIYSVTPFVAAILSYFLLKERFSKQKMFGIFLGFIGLFPIFFLEQTGSEGASFFSISLREVALLLSATFGCYAWFDIKKLMDRNYPLLTINGIAMLTGGILALITTYFVDGFSPCPIYDFWPFIFWLMILIFVSNVVFYNLYGWLIKKYSITLVTFVGFLSPVFGALFGWFFLGENISWHYFVSLFIIIIALFVFYKSERLNARN